MSQSAVFFTATDQLPTFYEGLSWETALTHSLKGAHLTGCHKRRAFDVEINTFHHERGQ